MGKLGVEEMGLKQSELESKMRHSIYEADIHSMETHQGFFFVQRSFVIYPSIPINAEHFSAASARISCLFLVAAGTRR